MAATNSHGVKDVNQLYRQHSAWLQNWLYRRLGCSETAADLAHDTFIRVIKQQKVSQLRQPRAHLSSIARNLMVDMFRRRSIENAYLDSLARQAESVEISPEQRHSIIEVLAEIDAMLDGLGDRTRQIFVLAQIDGLSYVAIANRIGVSVNTVRKHFIRAMTQCLTLVES